MVMMALRAHRVAMLDVLYIMMGRRLCLQSLQPDEFFNKVLQHVVAILDVQFMYFLHVSQLNDVFLLFVCIFTLLLKCTFCKFKHLLALAD